MGMCCKMCIRDRYDAVKMMATLPYVDKEKIGVTGHSNGALASRTAVLLDNEAEKPLIEAALLVSNDAVYKLSLIHI